MRQGADERIAVTAALASLLAALTLAPLVSGYTWVFVAAIGIVVSMVSGIVARQLLRWWPAVLLAQLLVLVLALLVLFARSRVVEGTGVITLLRDLARSGLEVTREQAPPVDSTQGIILLVAGGTGLVAVLVDLLATTLRQPALAGLPLLAVYCVPAALLDGGLPWYYFFFAGAGFLLLLTADSGDRVRSWGRVLTAAGSGRHPDSGTASGGRTVGTVALLLAIAVPTVVPGLGSQIIGGGGEGDGSGSGGRTITRVNPIIDLRKDLASPQDTPLVRYTTQENQPGPLRIVTSDVYDGKTWAPGTEPIPRSQKARSGLPDPPGLTSDVKVTTVRTSISIGNLNETYLPLPYPATAVDVDGDWLYDADTLNVIGDHVTTRNLKYSVTHLVVEPTAQQLNDSQATAGSVPAKYSYLPPDLPQVITDTALKVARTGSSYQKAVRLQRWLRTDGGFVYSLDAPEPRSGNSGNAAIADFLQQKRGYCVHFASAMAVMARTLGIPARIAVGFLPGQRQDDGSMLISAHDAHAWPELYFEGVGWVRFEPTPRSGLADPPKWSLPPSGLLPEDAASASAQPSAAPSDSASSRASVQPSRPARDDSVPVATGDSGAGVPWKAMLLVLTLVLALSLPRLVATLSSRRRWNRARSAPELAEAAWDDLRLGLSDLGVGWAASWTPRAVQRRLSTDHSLGPDARAALDRLTVEIENARYARPDDDLGRSAGGRGADVEVVTAAVAVGRPSQMRWQARLWPRSGVDRVAALWPWMNTTADRAGRQASALGDQVKDRVGTSRSGQPDAVDPQRFARRD